jgi:8-oxo-dGTP pyrophosphatase MutT (NUDIX family)
LGACGLDQVSLSEETIRTRLHANGMVFTGEDEQASAHEDGLEELRPAAVLIPLVCQAGEWHVLFIRRTESMPDHKGQVAFPGGAREAEDDGPESTGLRETYEELGIHPEAVRLLGRLEDIRIASGYRVTPLVGVVAWPYPLTLEQAEVARAFTIPLAWLADLTHRQMKPYQRKGQEIPVIFFESYDQEVLWGASAQMMVNLLTVLGL